MHVSTPHRDPHQTAATDAFFAGWAGPPCSIEFHVVMPPARENVRVEEIGPQELATHDPRRLMFVNVNTPHDYERATTLDGRRAGSRAARGDRIMDGTP